MNRERLQKLAEHLESGKLAHEEFDINNYNVTYNNDLTINWDDMAKPNHCGTSGCALGECPALWPGVWKWAGNQVVLVGTVDQDGDEFDGLDAAVRFFDITHEQSHGLFLISGYQGSFDGKVTRHDVAKKIRGLLDSDTQAQGEENYKQKEEYSAENTACPFCGSDDVSQCGIENQDGVVVCDVECDDCNETWSEAYSFSSVSAYR